MHGFRAARNRKHPGDPPSKWAPLGSYGRVVILLTVVTGIVIALVTTATRSAGALDGSDVPTDQTESSSREPGERVVVPEAGIALTVPTGWGFRVEMLETDWVEEAGVTEDVAVWRVLDMWSPDGDPELAEEHCSIGMLRAGDQGIEIMMTSDPTPAPGDVPPGWTHSITEVLVPAGLSTRIDWVIVEPDGQHYSTTYNLVGPDGPTWLGCQGAERPVDYWLPIAASFEFLPEGRRPLAHDAPRDRLE